MFDRLGLLDSFEDGVGLLGWHRFFHEIDGKPGWIMGLRRGQHKEYSLNRPVRLAHDAWRRSLSSGAQKEPWSVAAYVSQVLWHDRCNKHRR